jgi:type II secretory pathway component HofQ
MMMAALILLMMTAQATLVQAGPKKDVRPRVSIDYVQADVRWVLKQLARKMGVNIVMDDTVKGTVTLSIKNVPADGVFKLVLQLNDLHYKSLGSTIVVGSQETLDRIPDTVLR